jgi:agmatine deiminase
MSQSQIANRKSQITKTPRELGYTFPAEWAPQRGTMFSWPRPEGISFPGRYRHIGDQLCEIMRIIALRQEVHINVPNDNWQHIVEEQLKRAGVKMQAVTFHHVKTNESWCRDHGPAVLVNSSRKQLAIVDWGFNAWGGKYPPYDDDDAVPTRVAKGLGIKTVFNPGIIMEGGAVDFNGLGTVLTTTDCLLNKNRNPHLSREQIEQYLKDYYGQKHVCWLTGGIDGDDTDGHIDDLARFIDPHTIAFAVETNAKDANYKVLQRVRKQIDKLRDQDGEPFRVLELPMPKPVVIDGQRCPATYLNFLFINGALLVPIFGQKSDAEAIHILQDALPKHQVIGLNCSELIWGLGAIHCLSQQIPKA